MKSGPLMVFRYSSRYEKVLPDAEWNYIESHMPAPKGHGRLSIHDFREILKAVFFYVLKSGYQ